MRFGGYVRRFLSVSPDLAAFPVSTGCCVLTASSAGAWSQAVGGFPFHALSVVSCSGGCEQPRLRLALRTEIASVTRLGRRRGSERRTGEDLSYDRAEAARILSPRQATAEWTPPIPITT